MPNSVHRLKLRNSRCVQSDVPEPGVDSWPTQPVHRQLSLDETQSAAAKHEETAELLELAARLSRIGAFSIAARSLHITWSHEALQIQEVAPGADVPTIGRFLTLIHPEHVNRVEEALQRCWREGTGFDVEVNLDTTLRNPIRIRLIGEAHRLRDGAVGAIRGAIQDISDRKAADDQVRRLSHQLASTLASITEAFFTLDRQWRFTYLNHEAERLLGTSRDDLLGRVVWEVFPQGVGSEIHLHYQRAMAEFTAARFSAYSPVLGLWLEVNAFPSAEGLAVYFSNISEAKDARDGLAESEERYRMLFECSVDAILQTSPQGDVLHANAAACAMFGMTEEAICRATPRALTAPKEHGLKELQDDGRCTGKAVRELTMVRGDGSRFEAEVSTSQYVGRDGVVQTHMVLRDLTERISHRDAITALNTDLSRRVIERTQELQAANGELKAFANSLAHDLRAPVSAIRGFSALLLQPGADTTSAERRSHYISRIAAAAGRMNDFIDALLSLAEISQAPLEMADVDLSAIAGNILSDFQAVHPDRIVVAHVQPHMTARGDAALMTTVLENLIGNAWKFTSRKACAEISLSATVEDGETVYCVGDNGAGFNMAYAGQLFGVFRRLHRESEFPGTGIGLANVHRIITRHGGRIWVQSVEGEGATFRFTLAR